MTFVQFQPPPREDYTRIVLRVCKRGSMEPAGPLQHEDTLFGGGAGGTAGFSEFYDSDMYFPGLRYRGSRGLRRISRLADAARQLSPENSSSSSSSEGTPPAHLSTQGGGGGGGDCVDYPVAKPQSGEVEIHLSETVQLYNFRLIVYRGMRIVETTTPVVWQPREQLCCFFIFTQCVGNCQSGSIQDFTVKWDYSVFEFIKLELSPTILRACNQ